MSLALIQGYSSAEEEDKEDPLYHHSSEEDQEEVDEDDNVSSKKKRLNSSDRIPLFDPKPSSASSLPSALDAFSEVEGPPQFLNNCVVDESARDGDGQQPRHGRRRNRRDKRDIPAGAVVMAKPQLVGIHERVRSDEGSNPQSSANGSMSTAQGGKRIMSVSNPNAEDAAELLRMCVRCGIPKTYSNAKGIVCPVCGDRPPADADNEPVKKKGSAIKEKEKSKRMKGQSSHATWKSETEMQLRQQFD